MQFFATPAEASAWLAADRARLLLTSPTLMASLPTMEKLMRWHISTDDWVVVGAGR